MSTTPDILTPHGSTPTGVFADAAGPPTRRWQGGERVTRELYLDDGTWMRCGDRCLAASPLRRGVVTRRDTERRDGVWVKWDGEANERRYLDHGIAKSSGSTGDALPKQD